MFCVRESWFYSSEGGIFFLSTPVFVYILFVVAFSILRRKLLLLSISHMTGLRLRTATFSCLLTSKVLPEQKLDIHILSLQWLAACPPLM